MGDRANIKVYQDDGESAIFLYTHWRGDEIYDVVMTTLLRHDRWEDTAYLTRMLFCELVGDDNAGSNGFGISTSMCDNEHTIIGVNPERQEITFEGRDGTVIKEMSFNDFIQSNKKDYTGESNG